MIIRIRKKIIISLLYYLSFILIVIKALSIYMLIDYSSNQNKEVFEENIIRKKV